MNFIDIFASLTFFNKGSVQKLQTKNLYYMYIRVRIYILCRYIILCDNEEKNYCGNRWHLNKVEILNWQYIGILTFLNNIFLVAKGSNS